MWQIDFNTLIKWLLPTIVRVQMFFEYLQVAFAPMFYLQDLFNTHRSKVDTDLRYQCSVADLEYRLVTEFEDSFIYIENNQNITDSYIFTDAETDSVYVFTDDDYINIPGLPLPFLFSDTVSNNVYDFTVYVPIYLEVEDKAISNLVTKYKPTGKTFNIIRYE